MALYFKRPRPGQERNGQDKPCSTVKRSVTGESVAGHMKWQSNAYHVHVTLKARLQDFRKMCVWHEEWNMFDSTSQDMAN